MGKSKYCSFLACSKKLRLSEQIGCKCGLFFCLRHRYRQIHNCTHDHKTEWKLLIQKNNPVIDDTRLNRI